MKVGFVLKSILLAAVPTCVLFFLSRELLDQFEALRKSTTEVKEDLIFARELSDLENLRLQSEVSQKIFLLTEKRKHLETYTENRPIIRDRSRRMTKREPSLSGYSARLEKYFSSLDASVKERRYGLNHSLQVLFTGEGRRNSEHLHKASKNLRLTLESEVKRDIAELKESGDGLDEIFRLVLMSSVFFVFCNLIWIMIDLRKQRKLERAMLFEKERALEASEFKGRFLANMSHEIRTPLNSILGMAQLLSETNLTIEQKDYVDRFNRAGENLLKIVNDILDLSKIEEGELLIEKIEFSPLEVLTDAFKTLEFNAKQKGIELEVKTNLDVACVMTGDPTRLGQVLINIAGNAIKFTEKGKVTLCADQEENLLKVSILDTGIGISEENRKKIFNAFSQADTSTTRKFGGTGLGLSITKQLVELMGAELRVESELGKGSRFSFELKTSFRSRKAGQSVQSIEKTKGPMVLPNGLSILMADDVAENRNLVNLMLKSFQPKIVQVENGEEAFNEFVKGRFDLVLMDMQMPVLDGISATKKIREWEKSEGKQKTPVVALTAQAFQEEVQEILEAGCIGHISKPIKKKILIEKISLYLDEKPMEIAA